MPFILRQNKFYNIGPRFNIGEPPRGREKPDVNREASMWKLPSCQIEDESLSGLNRRASVMSLEANDYFDESMYMALSKPPNDMASCQSVSSLDGIIRDPSNECLTNRIVDSSGMIAPDKNAVVKDTLLEEPASAVGACEVVDRYMMVEGGSSASLNANDMSGVTSTPPTDDIEFDPDDFQIVRRGYGHLQDSPPRPIKRSKIDPVDHKVVNASGRKISQLAEALHADRPTFTVAFDIRRLMQPAAQAPTL